MKKLLIIFLFTLVLTSCKWKKEAEIQKPGAKILKISALIESALKGDKKANRELSGLLPDKLVNADYRKKIVDTISLSGKVVYYVMLQFTANPVYNRLAIYNEDLNLLLLDKSLNGDIVVTPFLRDNLKFLSVDENYMYKNIFVMHRFSLYDFNEKDFKLKYRDYNLVFTPNYFISPISQDILSLSKDTIKTTVSTPPSMGVRDTLDYYVFNKNEGKYISNKNLIKKIVDNELIQQNEFEKISKIKKYKIKR